MGKTKKLYKIKKIEQNAKGKGKGKNPKGGSAKLANAKRLGKKQRKKKAKNGK